MTARRWVATSFLVFAASAGCQFEWPGRPIAFPTTRVSGRLAAAGRPVHSGWLIFFPLEKTRGDHLVVAVDERGNFESDGVPVGVLQVRVKLPAKERARLIRQEGVDERKLMELAGIASPLRIETTRSAAEKLTIDIVGGLSMPKK